MPQKIFDYSDYRVFLKELIHAKESKRGLQSELARHMKCQSAYLYQVLRGKAQLTDDQAFRLAKHLNFSASEREYLFSLMRFAKASSLEFKEHLLRELQNVKRRELDLRNRADSPEADQNEEAWAYYMASHLPSTVHVLTAAPNYQTVRQIAKKLGISEKLTKEHLQKLAGYGLIKSTGDRWIHTGKSFHFAKDSSRNLVFQLMRRSQATAAIIHPQAEHTHFSTLFTLDRKTFEALRNQMADFIEKSQRLIHGGGSDELYVMCLDLFQPDGTK